MFKKPILAKNEERITIKPAMNNAWYTPKYETIEPKISGPLFKSDRYPDERVIFNYKDHNSDLNPIPITKSVKGVIPFKKYSKRTPLNLN